MEDKNLFDSEENLLKNGWKVIGRDVFTKGKQIKARCNHCSFISNIPLSNVDKANKKLIWVCQRCKINTAHTTNENALSEKW